ncbi:MAG: MFS transporter [Deinococcales bacterium]
MVTAPHAGPRARAGEGLTARERGIEPQLVGPGRRLFRPVHGPARHHLRQRALPTIQERLKEPFSNLQWIVNADTPVFGVLLVSHSRLGDIYGRKRMVSLGLGIFSLGSLLCAVSGRIEVVGLDRAPILNVLRCLQGLGSAALMLFLGLAASFFPIKRDALHHEDDRTLQPERA